MGMAACQGAYSWAREMRKLGHDVRLISLQCVIPYCSTLKNQFSWQHTDLWRCEDDVFVVT